MRSYFRHANRAARAALLPGVVCLGLVLSSAPARGLGEQPASLLVYPYVVAGATSGEDTILQLTNTANLPLDVQCFYENANRHCSANGAICANDLGCPSTETCEAGFAVTEFNVRLTAQQPIGWQASEGLASLPHQNNEGEIPPLPELPFVGVLRCIAVGIGGVPIEANALVGTATIERFADGPEPRLDVAKYGALGFQAVGPLVDDGRLVLGGFGGDAEYEGCANLVSYPHRFSPAFVADVQQVETTLVLIPCSASYGVVEAGRADVTYTVINDFGERRSRATPLSVEGLLAGRLTEIDPILFDRSAQGTDGGRTLLQSQGGGVIGLLIDTYTALGDPTLVGSAARGLRYGGQREDPDVISTLATPAVCTADCNADGRVDIAELVNAVGIALGLHDLSLCPAADTDDANTSVTIEELMQGVDNLLNGCP